MLSWDWLTVLFALYVVALLLCRLDVLLMARFEMTEPKYC